MKKYRIVLRTMADGKFHYIVQHKVFWFWFTLGYREDENFHPFEYKSIVTAEMAIRLEIYLRNKRRISRGTVVGEYDEQCFK